MTDGSTPTPDEGSYAPRNGNPILSTVGLSTATGGGTLHLQTFPIPTDYSKPDGFQEALELYCRIRTSAVSGGPLVPEVHVAVIRGLEADLEIFASIHRPSSPEISDKILEMRRSYEAIRKRVQADILSNPVWGA